MFDNIEYQGWGSWVCFLDDPYKGNHVAYAGDFWDGKVESVTGAEEYWHE